MGVFGVCHFHCQLVYLPTPLLICMFGDVTPYLARGFLAAIGTQITVSHQDRIPPPGALVVVSNHRSLLDAPLLTAALDRTVRFACHHYMSRVPILNEVVTAMGCFPLDPPGQKPRRLFNQASQSLQSGEAIGIFPEGAQPMVQTPTPQEMGQFHRGFAHLVLRVPVPKLAILPVAISSLEETISPVAPFRLFSLFDPSEPLFQRPGWHPAVHYQRVHLSVGRPLWIAQDDQERYQGRGAAKLARNITQACYAEISQLLKEGAA